nr:MAG TPA: Trimeric coiled-coil oligomerization domain of matrilin [Caudoviricetes sp.]
MVCDCRRLKFFQKSVKSLLKHLASIYECGIIRA